MTEERPTETRDRVAAVRWRSVAIAGAAAATGILALVALSDPAPRGPSYAVGDSTAQSGVATADPLRAELARCRTLPANADDARCRAAWEINRRRFMGESRSYVPPEPAPIEPAPAPIQAPDVAAPAIPTASER